MKNLLDGIVQIGPYPHTKRNKDLDYCLFKESLVLDSARAKTH